MRRERSQQTARPGQVAHDLRIPSGILYVVGMPIGHPDDITLRAIDILRRSDVIASEEPRTTQLLLAHHRIRTPVTSYGPRNLKDKVAVLIHRLQRGARVALVSDCGSPVISDPGCLLVRSSHSQKIRVETVPGPSALTAAIAASGISGDSFFFRGSVPESPPAIRRCLLRLLKRPETTVAFTDARSIGNILGLIARLAPRRIIIAACDLTGPGETVVRGTPRQVARVLAGRETVREVTLIIKGKGRLK